MTRFSSIRPLFDDPFLAPYREALRRRADDFDALEQKLAGDGTLADFASGHEWYGLHRSPDGGWVLREHAPNAEALWLVGDFSNWERAPRFAASKIGDGDWELRLPARALSHGQLYHMELEWPGGGGARLPVYARRVVQDDTTKLFAAQVWDPPRPYRWRYPDWHAPVRSPLIYEAHVGMAQEEARVGTYAEFRVKTLPRIAAAGYNTVQLMAVMEHPYYGSFGYQVSNFFAASSRFGTPEELKELVDAAHGLGIAVIMDIVHSHAVRNELEGPAALDGTHYLYFHDWRENPDGTFEGRGHHPVWDSVLFDYGKLDTLHLLLSNVRFWLDEYRLDGFRFDGVTSMLYRHHGIGVDFLGYGQYFDDQVDEQALAYLALANRVAHAVRPGAITIAEDVSGMPGLASPSSAGGAGFDYRMSMGVTEAWKTLLEKVPDENWHTPWLWHALTDKRADERVVSYVECHDQALVGGKTALFRMAGTSVYDAMHRGTADLRAQRAVALHKMMRLATLAAAGGGYLDFMGNEFGHPEWIDFPREGNGWSFDHARRSWSLADDPHLLFSALGAWGAKMVRLFAARPRLLDEPPKLLAADGDAHVLAFARGNLFFVFNFHPSRSHVDYEVPVPPGRYALLLDSDRPAFGGANRLPKTLRLDPVETTRGDQRFLVLRLYLPSRCALVLRRTTPRA